MHQFSLWNITITHWLSMSGDRRPCGWTDSRNVHTKQTHVWSKKIHVRQKATEEIHTISILLPFGPADNATVAGFIVCLQIKLLQSAHQINSLNISLREHKAVFSKEVRYIRGALDFQQMFQFQLQSKNLIIHILFTELHHWFCIRQIPLTPKKIKIKPQTTPLHPCMHAHKCLLGSNQKARSAISNWPTFYKTALLKMYG